MSEPDDMVDVDRDRAQRFVRICIQTWDKHRQPRDVLGVAMLAHAINLMLDESDAEEVAAVLAGLAAQISPPCEAGHA